MSANISTAEPAESPDLDWKHNAARLGITNDEIRAAKEAFANYQNNPQSARRWSDVLAALLAEDEPSCS